MREAVTPTPRQRRRRILIVFAIAASVVVCAPMWARVDGMSLNDDWLTFYTMHAMFRLAVVELGEFPLWSPWVGGGYPIVGHPEFANLTPFALPTLALGEAVGLKVNVFLFCLIGALGMAALAHGTLRLGLGGSLVAVGAYTLSGYLPGRVISGNPIELHLLWFPLLVVLFDRARATRAIAPMMGMAAILAVTMVDGKWIPAVLGLVLGLWSLTWCVGRGRNGRRRLTLWPAAVAAMACLMALPLAAAKLVPFVDLLQRAQAVTPDNPSVYSAVNCLHPGRLMAELTVGWPKVKYMVGVVPLALAGVAACRRPRWSARWVIVGGVAAWLMIGRHAPLDLFALLWRVPPFRILSSSHIPFGPFVVVAVSVLAGRAADDLVADRSPARRRWTIGLLLALTAAPLLARTAPGVLPVFRSLAVAGPASGTWRDFYHLQTTGLPRRGEEQRPLEARSYYQIKRHAGLIDWRGTILLPEHAVAKYDIQADGQRTARPGYPGAEVWCRDGGRAVLVDMSANTIQVEVATDGPDRLVVNQNYQRGWRSSAGPVKDVEGLIAVDLPGTGVHHVTLRFHSGAFALGLAISLGAWGLVAAVLLALGIQHRRRIRHVATRR